MTRVRPPTRHDRLKAKEIRTKEVRERQREGRMDPSVLFMSKLPGKARWHAAQTSTTSTVDRLLDKMEKRM